MQTAPTLAALRLTAVCRVFRLTDLDATGLTLERVQARRDHCTNKAQEMDLPINRTFVAHQPPLFQKNKSATLATQNPPLGRPVTRQASLSNG